jgi:glycosyltransferase involved in cell wall biosynthesis
VKLSIITPSYNYAAWLPDALASVHGQDVAAYEHVVLDDGSVDASVDVARAHPSAPRVIEQENVGLAETLNRLVPLVTGDWVGWLNADDFYLEGAFGTLKAVITQDPSIDIVVGDTVFVDESGLVQRLLPGHRITGSVTKHFGMTAATSAFFVNRAALEDVGFRRGTKFLMDKWLFWQLWETGRRFAYVPMPIGAMRRHDEQQSRVQRDPGAAERAEFRRALGLPTTGLSRSLSKAWGRGLHIAYKGLDGGLANEWRGRRHRGSDARWWLRDADPVLQPGDRGADDVVLRRTRRRLSLAASERGTQGGR